MPSGGDLSLPPRNDVFQKPGLGSEGAAGRAGVPWETLLKGLGKPGVSLALPDSGPRNGLIYMEREENEA